MLKNNGLSIALVALFALTMGGQAWMGWRTNNAEQLSHGAAPIAFSDYLSSGHFWEATGENWESEFLQMAMFVLLSTHLYQKGSAESKRLDVREEQDLDPRDFTHLPDVPGPVRRGGWRLRLYENSLGVTFLVIFAISFAIHAGGGLVEYNDERRLHHEPAVVLSDYLLSERFWFESFQNWQSEFLSLAGMVVGTIFLRQRGSAESKAVHAPHAETGKA